MEPVTLGGDYNSACPLILPTSTIYPSLSACVFGVIHDKKLSWQPHLQHIKSKLATQTSVLSRLTASTWGTSLRVSRLLYTALVRPVITTGCPAGRAPPLCHFINRGGETSSKGPKTIVLELSHGPTRPNLYETSRQKSALPLCPSTWTAEMHNYCLRSAESGIDRVMGEGILKVRQFLSCTRTRSRRSRTPRNQQTASNPHPHTSSAVASAPLAASQLSEAQQGFLRTIPDALPPFQ
jgi:hypothetical protein